MLLLLVGEINVGYQIGVGTSRDAFVVHHGQDSSGPCLTTGYLTDRVFASVGWGKMNYQRKHSVEEQKIAAYLHLEIPQRWKNWCKPVSKHAFTLIMLENGTAILLIRR